MSSADALAGRMLVINYSTLDMDEFARAAQRAAELGATHMNISDIPPSRWQMRDPKDPYPSWSMKNASIFKVIVPPQLSEWLPAEPARRNLELMRQRCEILRRHGLRGFFSGGEPMWLPEPVFAAHPEWRGPQCELLVIARHPHWSPCIDHPEVLQMYRRATAELCRELPEVDTFSFLTNDSGAGVCWSSFIYPGINGPLSCRERPMGQRLAGFLSAIQEGAAEAGVKAEVAIGGGFPSIELQAILPHLKQGQAVNGKYADGSPFGSGAGSTWFGNHTFPVVGVQQPLRFAREMEGAMRSSAPRVSVMMETAVAPVLWPILEEFVRQPSDGPESRMALLGRVAAKAVGRQNAERLLAVWELIDRAIECIRHVRNRGFASLLLVGPATQKWLIRPLVPRPLELTEEEKSYWRRHQFAARSEEEALDLQNVLGRPCIVGSAAVWMARWSLEDAIGHLKGAIRMLEALRKDVADAQEEGKLRLLALRLGALICAVRNAQNVIFYQDVLDRCDRLQPLVNTLDPHRNLVWDGRSMELRRIARAEIDNTTELIGLLQQTQEPLLALAKTPQEEDVFFFSPQIVEHLRKKVAVMMAHWEDYEQLYPSEGPTRRVGTGEGRAVTAAEGEEREER